MSPASGPDGSPGQGEGGRGASPSRDYWDRRAEEDPYWYVAKQATGDEAFFGQGGAEVDAYLAHCDLRPSSRHTVVEIGCGVGRMTRRLSEVFGRVVAVDVSPRMVAMAREQLADRPNVTWVVGSGRDLDAVPDASVEAVFSYITLQHVPEAATLRRYLVEAQRVLAPGGRAALQVRRPGWRAAAIDNAGHLWFRLAGRPTTAPEWRGTRLGAAELLATRRGPGFHLELRPRTLRHSWLVVTRDPGPAVEAGMGD